MSENASSTKSLDIPVNELKLGMYVKAISYKANQVGMKSEGYVTKTSSIDKLIKAGIKVVTVDPSKEKKTNNVDGVINKAPVIKKIPEDPLKKLATKKTLDDELNKANKLYENAKNIQEKIIKSISAGKEINVNLAEKTTDDMVDSIFRNQDALACMSQLKDKNSYLIEHALNCSILMAIFAKHLGIEQKIIKELTLGAFLHDIGKIFIPNEILNKAKKLSKEEFLIIETHVALGLKTLEDTPSISHIAMSLVKEHHERNDGSGYPKQLKSADISKYGHMMAIVDSYDAMTSERCYRHSIFPIQAFKTLTAESPEKYDKELVNKFIQCLGVYPVGTLVKLTSGKLGLISQLNDGKPLTPHVRVFYNTRMNQAIPIKELDLSKTKHNDQIDCCIKPEEFNLNLLVFFKAAFIN